MFNSAVRELLQKPLTARLATIDKNGYPHVVPLWFDMDGDDVIIVSDRNTRKIDYIALNPKGCLQLGGDAEAGVGYLLKGDLIVEPDPDYKWLKQVTRRYESGEQAEKDIELWRTTLDMIVIRLKVKKVIKVL
jgi:general stress protein 26